MLMVDIIEKKKKNIELSDEEIDFVVSGTTDGSIPDYQLSAFLMAVCLTSMTDRETTKLTLAMAQSGEMLDLSILGDNTVDKHSTGGVGDKTTLICTPIAAALGCKVAKMSGRGLGHTGGTVDKLQSLDGYKINISREEFLQNALKNGICIVGQGGDFAPADKKLYALRDVTATTDCIPLIASSIVSKKLASGAKNIVLDVKYGKGAFMKTPEEAEMLAKEMVKICKNAGRRAVALVTDMNVPLGRAVGNSVEVQEAIEILKGKGDKRLKELCILLAGHMYSLCFGKDIDAAVAEAENAINNGAALEKFRSAVMSAGGNVDLIDGKASFSEPEDVLYMEAEMSGYISDINSLAIGKAAMLCGAGRAKKEDEIDYLAGIILLKNIGDYVEKGDRVAVLQGNHNKIREAANVAGCAFSYSEQKPKCKNIVYKIIR